MQEDGRDRIRWHYGFVTGSLVLADTSSRRAFGALVAVTGAGLAVSTAAGLTPTIAAAGAAVLLLIIALAMFAPAFAGRLARFFGRPLSRAGVAGTLARWETLLDAMLGAVIGPTLGIGFGWVGARTLSEGRAVVMTVPAGRLAAYLMVVAVAGVVAGLFLARRAARLDVLESIATG